jgi:lambda family phage portal protein
MKPPMIIDKHGNPMLSAHSRAFVGASASHPSLARWTPRNYSPAEALHSSREPLVARIHDLARNDGWASAALSRHIDSAIGSGWRLSAKPNARRLGITQEVADELGSDIEAAFEEWAEDPRFYCDLQRRNYLGGLIALGYRHRLTEGDAFAVLHWSPDRPYATTIEIIHPDRCVTPTGRREGYGVRSGVEIGKNGEPIGYHFLVQHPGEGGMVSIGVPRATKYIPREDQFGRPIVVHAFEMTEAGQVRGVPLLAPIVKKLRMLGRYDEAELQASVLNAVLAAFITTPHDPDLVAGGLGGLNELTPHQQMRLDMYGEAPINVDGVRVNFLAPGDKAEFLNPRHPNSVFEQFERTALRNVASASGLSYEQLSMDWSQSNYSSARAALLEVWRGLTARRQYFARTFMQPIYAAWLEEAIDKGQVRAPATARPFREALGAWTRAKWIGPARGWVDPVKESTAAALRMAHGLSTLEDECAEQGKDYQEVLLQLAREKREKEKLGLVFEKVANDPGSDRGQAEERAP